MLERVLKNDNTIHGKILQSRQAKRQVLASTPHLFLLAERRIGEEAGTFIFPGGRLRGRHLSLGRQGRPHPTHCSTLAVHRLKTQKQACENGCWKGLRHFSCSLNIITLCGASSEHKCHEMVPFYLYCLKGSAFCISFIFVFLYLFWSGKYVYCERSNVTFLRIIFAVQKVCIHVIKWKNKQFSNPLKKIQHGLLSIYS